MCRLVHVVIRPRWKVDSKEGIFYERDRYAGRWEGSGGEWGEDGWKMVSTWGARDIEEERKSKRSCQNQTRRRSSGYLAYPIGTRNESMKQVLTEIPLLTTFPKEIESKRCLPPRSNRPVNLCLDTPRWKKHFQWYVGSPITESRNSNNRSFRSSWPLSCHYFLAK